VRYPKQAYMTAVESWRELPGGDIEFTRRDHCGRRCSPKSLPVARLMKCRRLQA
jgi:hypothetical protein